MGLKVHQRTPCHATEADPVTRASLALAALNRHGSATALTLPRETRVPRATVYRLLQTLLDNGYLSRGTVDGRFHLQLKVRDRSRAPPE